MSTLGKAFSVAHASRLASSMRLAAVHVSGIKAQVVTGGDLAGDFGWRLRPIDITWGVADGQVRVVIPTSLEILRAPKSDGSPERIATVGVMLRLDYDVSDGAVDDDGIESFIGISGCMHAWPYLRSEVQQLTTKLELPPLMLPPIVSGQVSQLVGEVTRESTNPEPKPKRRKKLPHVRLKRKRRPKE